MSNETQSTAIDISSCHTHDVAHQIHADVFFLNVAVPDIHTQAVLIFFALIILPDLPCTY